MSRVVVRVRKTESISNFQVVNPPRRSAKEQALFDAGRRYVHFVWPISLMDALVALAEKEGVRPNVYVQNLAERHVAGLSEENCSGNQQTNTSTEVRSTCSDIPGGFH